MVKCKEIITKLTKNLYLPYHLSTHQKEKQNLLIDLINKILLKAKENKFSKTFEQSKTLISYQKEINSLVYKLYDLNDHDIDIIENNLTSPND